MAGRSDRSHEQDVPVATPHLRCHAAILPSRSKPTDIGPATGRGRKRAGNRLRNRPKPCVGRPAASDALFFGIDVSTEMLTSAVSAVSRRGLTNRIPVAHGDATGFDPDFLFGIRSFDHILISYSLSMIPDWRRVVETGLGHLAPGGRLHIVDFGTQQRLPGFVRAALLR